MPTPPNRPVVWAVTISIARGEPLAARAGGSHQRPAIVGNNHLPSLSGLAGPTSSEWSSSHLSRGHPHQLRQTTLADMLEGPYHMIHQTFF